MQKFSLALLLTIVLLFCFSQGQPPGNTIAENQKIFNAAEKLYIQAEQLYARSGDNEALQAKAEVLFQQSLAAFNKLIPEFKNPGHDSLAFATRVRTGYIHYFFDSLAEAKQDYLQAIAGQKLAAGIPDSALFEPLLYTGSIYYSTNQFDSALLFYKKAAAINDKYNKPLKEAQRLYNRLGVMYYETGNYRQARNYFEKAIEVYATTPNADKNLLANYKNNIASILVKLDELDQARLVYESLLPSSVFANEINHNLGIINLKQSIPEKAIAYFKKVNYADSKKNIDLYYNFALSHAALHNTDSAESWIYKAIAENIRWNGHQKNTTYGLILKFQGDEASRRQEYEKSLEFYQQALHQFCNNFDESDITKNPDSFTTVFSYINLFTTLTAKADAFKKRYEEERKIPLLVSSLDAYRCAFRLADYVARTYDSDEARLFLGKIKHTVHSEPIDISLQLFDLTHQKEYLEEAYLFDQRNKATVLSLNLQLNEIRTQSGETGELLQKESSLKSNITRSSLKAATITDTVELQKIYASIRDNEIELGKLQEKINEDPVWQQKRATEKIPSIAELQKKLDPTTTLLSYHLSQQELLILLISANQFEYHKVAVNKSFFNDVDLLKASLQQPATDNRYGGTDAAINLYRKMIDPVQLKLQQKKRLIIIPDDELNYLPFEALQDENKKYLVEKFAIQYQFSTALASQAVRHFSPSNTLAFAPYASNGYDDPRGDKFSILPSSKEETGQLRGMIFTDAEASKKKFLFLANQYSIVHLATHASVNNEDPMQSFIAFYPDSNYKLYAREIYDLKLDSLQLIILSACETGSGQLVKGEGLMSLSRAFTYAGCPNIITSLWKAEDKSTAFITERLHYYLEKKFTTDQALQQAKLDLLKSSTIDPRLKSPTYWAHLVFIGTYEADHKSQNWWWIAIAIIVGAVSYKLIRRKRPRSNVGALD